MDYDIVTFRRSNTCRLPPLFGFRGTANYRGEPWARLVIGVDEPVGEILLVDVPARCLPYPVDESPGSDFDRGGYWHHFPVQSGYSVVGELAEDRICFRPLKVVLDGTALYGVDLDLI